MKRVTQQLCSQEDREQVSTQNFCMNTLGSSVNKSNGGNDPSASPEERIKKASVLSTRGATQPQRTEALTLATVWVTLRERGQTQKTTYFMTIYIKCPKTSNLEGQSR